MSMTSEASSISVGARSEGPATAAGRRYLIVSPCRNEEKFMRRTLDSVVAQSIRPALWVIVDDGSTDSTPQILAEYAAKHDFIRIVPRKDRGTRSVGPGVIEAFYAGYETVDPSQYDYVCKLDLDLDLPVRYFELLMKMMEEKPRLGNISGKAYYIAADGRRVRESISDEVSVGASKFYRMTCFQQVGGFVRQVMWDGIDCHRCRMKGWLTGSFDDAEIQFLHLRPMGTSQKGIWTGRIRHGFGQYFMGSSIWYMTASAVYRVFQRPYVIGGIAVWWGYVKSMLTGVKRYDDLEFRKFLREFQWLCLTRGKRRASEMTDRKQEAVWKPPTRAGA